MQQQELGQPRLPFAATVEHLLHPVLMSPSKWGMFSNSVSYRICVHINVLKGLLDFNAVQKNSK